MKSPYSVKEYAKSGAIVLLVLWLVSLQTVTAGVIATGVLVAVGIYGLRKALRQLNQMSKSVESV